MKDLTGRELRRRPLPRLSKGGDKNERGAILVVGGSRDMPGAIVLAATAALRAGAGKLQIATARSVATGVAVEVPEARVFGLTETRSGAFSMKDAREVAGRAADVDAVVVGPGMIGDVTPFFEALLERLRGPVLVVDAEPLACFATNTDLLRDLGGRAVVTPHEGEFAKMTGVEKKDVRRAGASLARDAAKRWNAVIALKGAETLIVHPSGQAYRNRRGSVGLGTSGSGDSLAGIVGGLAARGAPPFEAAMWGVHLHAMAGEALARKMGPLGFLARELLAEIPRLMAARS